MMTRTSVALAFVWAPMAWAGPGELTYQGRILGSDGSPSHGSETLTIGLYTAASGGSAVWSETDAVSLSDGYFTTTLGDQSTLSSLDFATTAYFVGITPSSGTELLPRTPLQAVPVAMAIAGGGAAGSGPLVFGRESIGHAQGWIDFPRPMTSDPVIIGTVNELNDSGAVTHRVLQSSRHGFGFSTWNCSAADIPDSYSYLAVEPGVHTIDGATIEAGHLGATSGNAFSITFASPFSQTPVVLLDVDERGNNSGAVTCRVEALSNTAASGRCWNNSTGDNADGIYYVALEPTPAAGLAYNGQRIHAGHQYGASSNVFSIPAPAGSVAAPGVMLLTVENNGTSGGPTSARTRRASNGTTVTGRSWHCPAGEARTPFGVHWLFID